MQLFFQSVSTNKFTYSYPKKFLSFKARIELYTHLVSLNWLVIFIISITLFMMSPQFTHAQSTTNYHHVRSGDTLTIIAYRYKVSVRSLTQANSLVSDLIHVDDLLIIPAAPLELPTPLQQVPPRSAHPTDPQIVQPPASAKVAQGNPTPLPKKSFVPRCSQGVYVVQRGDTLYSIAIRSNSNIIRIKHCNNLPSNSIWAGQVLVGIYIPKIKASAVR